MYPHHIINIHPITQASGLPYNYYSCCWCCCCCRCRRCPPHVAAPPFTFCVELGCVLLERLTMKTTSLLLEFIVYFLPIAVAAWLYHYLLSFVVFFGNTCALFWFQLYLLKLRYSISPYIIHSYLNLIVFYSFEANIICVFSYIQQKILTPFQILPPQGFQISWKMRA